MPQLEARRPRQHHCLTPLKPQRCPEAPKACPTDSAKYPNALCHGCDGMGGGVPKRYRWVTAEVAKCAQPRTRYSHRTTARCNLGDYIRGAHSRRFRWWQLSKTVVRPEPKRHAPSAIPASVPVCGQPHGARSQGSITTVRIPRCPSRHRGSSPASTASRQRRDLWIVGLWLSIPQVIRGEARFGIRLSDVTILGYAPLDPGMPQSCL